MTTRLFDTKYGYFDQENQEYVITRPDTPRPWVNVISNGDYGIVESQAGGGFSWRTNANLNRLTRWSQDMVKDEWGKFVFCRDEDTKEFWSLAWKPVCADPQAYKVRHGMGYSVFKSQNREIATEMTRFIPRGEPLEIWKIKVKNSSSRRRTLSFTSYLEWLCGVAPDTHREFHRVFLETIYDPKTQILFAQKRLWELKNKKGQHWNRSWEYTGFHAANLPVKAFEGDKESFIGMYASEKNPRAMGLEHLENHQGKWNDSIGALQVQMELEPGEEKSFAFLLGMTEKQDEAKQLVKKYAQPTAVENSLRAVKQYWQELLSALEVKTPDPAFDIMNNVWLKYQAISCRLWGRTAYYQSSGAYGFRDQLQDSQVFFYNDPQMARDQILLHARHQFLDGTVFHWWLPLNEEGPKSKFSDDLLWMPFIIKNYILETGDERILKVKAPYVDGPAETLYAHCKRAINLACKRVSRRGLPLIGEGDWNDGLSGAGHDGKGESCWVAMFLYGILKDFAPVAQKQDDKAFAGKCRRESEKFKALVNKYGWDGNWYIRATTDAGKILGSSKNPEGKIFLNAQSWAVINDIGDDQRLAKSLAGVKKYLAREYGPILFYPAYSLPDEGVGYLTRYAPGLRENGGLYTHAGNWAIQAFAKVKDDETAWSMYRNMCPALRGQEPDLYKAEPYVTPGNVDGPNSPNFGRAGWTWYTGSATWMLRIGVEWLLGVRPTDQGLLVDPCIPADWKGFTIKRLFRGATYFIEVDNSAGVSSGVKELFIEGKKMPANVIPIKRDKKSYQVKVIMGKN